MRHFDLNRTRPAGAELTEGLVDQRRHLLGRRRPRRMLGHGSDHVELVWNLVQEAAADADEIGSDLPGDAEHGRVGRIGGRKRRRRVEQAGAGHDDTDAFAAGGAGEAVGHVGGRLLVTRMDHPKRGAVVIERREKAIELHARQCEKGVDALALEALQQRLAARQGLGFGSSLLRAWLNLSNVCHEAGSFLHTTSNRGATASRVVSFTMAPLYVTERRTIRFGGYAGRSRRTKRMPPAIAQAMPARPSTSTLVIGKTPCASARDGEK